VFLKKCKTCLIASALFAAACTGDSENTGFLQTQDAVQVTPLTDTLFVPCRIQTGDFHAFSIWSNWGQYGRMPWMSCDSSRVYLPNVSDGNYTGRCAFSWNGDLVWTIDRSTVNNTLIDLDARYSLDSTIIQSHWGNLLFIGKKTGELIGFLPIGTDSGIDNTKLNFSQPFSLCNRFILVWYFPTASQDHAVLTVTDDSLKCLWELVVIGDEEPFSLVRTTCNGDTAFVYSLPSFPQLSSFQVTCSDSTFYLNPCWMDVVMSFDVYGNLLAVFEGDHQALSERMLCRGGSIYYRREMVPKIDYLGNDILAILYGPVAFTSDSSEIWCVNLATGKYGVLPFSKAVTSFAATQERVAVSSCRYSQDSVSSLWSTYDGEVFSTSWNLTPIYTLREQEKAGIQ